MDVNRVVRKKVFTLYFTNGQRVLGEDVNYMMRILGEEYAIACFRKNVGKCTMYIYPQCG